MKIKQITLYLLAAVSLLMLIWRGMTTGNATLALTAFACHLILTVGVVVWELRTRSR